MTAPSRAGRGHGRSRFHRAAAISWLVRWRRTGFSNSVAPPAAGCAKCRRTPCDGRVEREQSATTRNEDRRQRSPQQVYAPPGVGKHEYLNEHGLPSRPSVANRVLSPTISRIGRKCRLKSRARPRSRAAEGRPYSYSNRYRFASLIPTNDPSATLDLPKRQKIRARAVRVASRAILSATRPERIATVFS